MARNSIVKRSKATEIELGNGMPRTTDIPVPPTSVRALTLWLILTGVFLFGGLGFWAATAPLSSAVIANGQFEVDGDLRSVQHLSGGIITEIHVRDGESVAEGQVIARLDPTRSIAQLSILRNQLASALSRRARLQAEFDGAETIRVDSELQAMMEADAAVKESLAAQVAVFKSNRAMNEGQVAILTDRIHQLDKQRLGITARRDSQEQQLVIVREELADLESLLDRGLATRERVMARKRAETQLLGDIGESEGSLFTIDEEVSEFRQRVLQVERDRRKAIADELEILQEQIIDVRQRLDASQKLSEQLTIRAPVTGRIVGLELNTLGGVIEPGTTIMRVVPEGSEFVVRGRVFPGDINEVELGATVRIRLSAYNYRKTAPVEGTLTFVSADTVLDERSGERFFEVEARISEEVYAANPEVKPVPSMPAQLFIETGQQTLLTYLIDPVIGGLEMAMREGN